jgi:putative protein kinase ArgK-like GTPase of G3E family
MPDMGPRSGDRIRLKTLSSRPSAFNRLVAPRGSC